MTGDIEELRRFVESTDGILLMAVQSKIEIAVKDDHATVEAERGRSEYSFIISPETAQIGGADLSPFRKWFQHKRCRSTERETHCFLQKEFPWEFDNRWA